MQTRQAKLLEVIDMRIFAAALLQLTLISNVAVAQEQTKPAVPSPEQMQQMMQGAMKSSMNAMLDVAGPMATATIEAQTAAAAKPETAERIATFKKNLYDALMKKGFTSSQALQIVVATGTPTASTSMK